MNQMDGIALLKDKIWLTIQYFYNKFSNYTLKNIQINYVSIDFITINC
jgi:hypothetical protein